MKLLQNAVNYNDAPILCFKKSVHSSGRTCENDVLPWPCFPRMHSVLSKPDIVLDLPNIAGDFSKYLKNLYNSNYCKFLVIKYSIIILTCLNVHCVEK